MKTVINKIKNIDKEKRYIYITLFIFSVLAILKLFSHEPWRDEAQAWLLARDLNCFELIANMKFEGHPILWHLCLKVLQLFKLPYFSQMVLHVILNILAVYLILAKIKMDKYLKLLFIFSDIVAFEYLVFSRNYVLVLLLLVIIAIVYKDRFKRPILYSILLILLANTTSHALGVVFALSLIYLFEAIKKYRNFRKINRSIDEEKEDINKKNEEKVDEKLIFSKKKLITVVICTIIIILVSIAVIMLLNNQALDGKLVEVSFPKTVSEWKDFIINGLNTYGAAFIGNIETESIYENYVGIAMLICGIVLFIRNPKVLFLYVFSSGFLCALFNLVLYRGVRHLYLYVLIFMFCLWIKSSYEEIEINETKDNLRNISEDKEVFKRSKIDYMVNVLLSFFLFLLVIIGIVNTGENYLKIYSDGKNVANFIKSEGYTEYTFISLESAIATSILPYIKGKELWCIEDENYHTYIPWTKEFNNIIVSQNNIEEMIEKFATIRDIKEVIDENFDKKDNLLLIFDKRILLSEEYLEELNLVYTSDETIIDERFNIFTYKMEE